MIQKLQYQVRGNSVMILLKFGQKEHLEQLKNGMVHFRPIEYFRKERTSFRGDPMEGTLYLNPNKPFLINGTDISPMIEKATISREIKGNVLSFSASILSKDNCHSNNDNTFTPNDDFVEEMSKFGDHVLIFNEDLIIKLRDVLDPIMCLCVWRPVLYCDKNNPDEVRNVCADTPEDIRDILEFFKDKSYKKQNEWRIVVFDTDNHFRLLENGGVNIETSYSTKMPIFRTVDLKTLIISDD
jgi:hypothetical protein